MHSDSDVRFRLAYSISAACGRVVALVSLVALLPVLCLIWIAIKLDDRGPAIFRQPRLGHAGRPFTIWKFRTMIVDADDTLDATGAVTTDRGTRVGRVLRVLSLDELPQLVNIVRGEMAIVGPRPVLPSHWARYTDEQRRRFDVRPGITGLAQVRGRNTIPWSERIRHDLEYIDRYSPWLDVTILARTVKVVTFREGIMLDRNPDQVDDLGADDADEGRTRR